jgi:hypothetical protein
MPAQLVDLDGEFDLGNYFTLEVAERLAHLLSDEYRVIVKYDRAQPLPEYSDNNRNVVISTSRETHDVPGEFFREDVFIIFQHYFMLDGWGDPLYNPLAYPMPLGPFKEAKGKIVKPLSERKYDFSFVGQMPDTGTRDCFKRHLDQLVDKSGDKFKYFIKYTDGFGQGLPTEEYTDVLSESRVSLCPKGAHSYETFRFFESIMMGAIPLVEQLPRLWYYESAPHFKTVWRDLDRTLSRILNFTKVPDCRDFLYQVANYCNDTLNPENLAKHLRDKVKIRKATLDMNKQNLDEFRKMLSATVLRKEL